MLYCKIVDACLTERHTPFLANFLLIGVRILKEN